MSMMKLALLNYKNSFKNYLSLIVSLAFTILIFLNFQNLVYSDIFDMLGESNKEYIIIIIQVITIVLCCFMLFFIWYSTNVFLTKRKKEIGTYIFMGLSNQKIGKLYMIETALIGFTALCFGLFFGILSTKLFQMILVAISDITVPITFQFSIEPIIITSVSFIAIYMIFIIKGYVNIVRSSVLDMVSANRKNEFVKQKVWLLSMKAIFGIITLGIGYYLAIKDGGQEVMGNVLIAVILVTVGVYLLFGGCIPLIIQTILNRKKVLYKKQRNLWVNNISFRLKKNYRTYAIICVLLLCSVTALATGFAMNNRYHAMTYFRNMYTYQVMSTEKNLDRKLHRLINKDNEIEYANQISSLQLDSSKVKTKFKEAGYTVVPYSQLKKLAKDANLEFDLKEPADDEIIETARLYLLSLTVENSQETVTINNKEYNQIESTSIPYLGMMQEKMSIYIVNDEEYNRMLPLGQELEVYSYKINDIKNYKASMDELDTINVETNDEYTAYIATDYASNDIVWVKVIYSICVFMFMVFVLASGSIIFMKLYNDAFEERGRYKVLMKLGIDRDILKKSVRNELRFSYGLPFVVMAISSYFSVNSLAKLMKSDLLQVNMISLLCIFVILYICYQLSAAVYIKNIELDKG